MKNIEIISNSIQEWAIPIITKATQQVGGGFLSSVINPSDLLSTVANHALTPTIHKTLSFVPDEVLPDMIGEILDKMIEKRAKEGALTIPVLGIQLTPQAFKNLKTEISKNVAQYTETVVEDVANGSSL